MLHEVINMNDTTKLLKAHNLTLTLLISFFFLLAAPAASAQPDVQVLFQHQDPNMTCIKVEGRQANLLIIQTRKGERTRRPRVMRRNLGARLVALREIRRTRGVLTPRQQNRIRNIRTRRQIARQCNRATLPPIPEEPADPEPTPEPTPAPDPHEQSYTDSIEQYGIAWLFDDNYPYGQFANGDYWVLGPITIEKITPDFTGEGNGFEIDPQVGNTQGFDHRINGFDANLVPSLPLTINPHGAGVNAISLVKAISRDPLEATGDLCGASGSDRNCLKTASVLTVLSEVPENHGSTVYRPAYVYMNGNKPIKSTTELRPDLLASLPSTQNAREPEWVVERFKRVHLGHLQSVVHTQRMRPKDYLPSYGANFAIMNTEAALTLMLDYPEERKLPAIVAFTQAGLDLYGMLLAGKTWEANGGHGLIGKLGLVTSAVLFDDQEMKDNISGAPYNTFHEDGQLYFSPHANHGNGAVLYGAGVSESNYWQRVMHGTASATLRDPYGYIDGGGSPGTSYQHCCNSLPWKYAAMVMHLLPEAKDVWNYDYFFEYTDRWVEYGAWALPDPCAPYDGNPANYGITFGPNGSGGCILDPNIDTFDSPSEFTCQQDEVCGRFPDRHFANADGGNRNGGIRSSTFGDEMWEAYR